MALFIGLFLKSTTSLWWLWLNRLTPSAWMLRTNPLLVQSQSSLGALVIRLIVIKVSTTSDNAYLLSIPGRQRWWEFKERSWRFTLDSSITSLGISVKKLGLPTLTSRRVSLCHFWGFFFFFLTNDQQVPDNSCTDPLQAGWLEQEREKETAHYKNPIYRWLWMKIIRQRLHT